MMTNKEIAKALRKLADLMEVNDDQPFKARAYANAAIAVGRATEQLTELNKTQIAAIKGIGNSTAEKISELITSGSLAQYQTLVKQTPPGIVTLLEIKGLGPSKVKTIWRQLGVETPDELLYACLENRLVILDGFGQKTQENIRLAIAYYLANQGSKRFADAEPLALTLLQQIRQLPGVTQAELTGQIRRLMPVVDTIELVVAAQHPEDLAKELNLQVEAQDPEKIISGKDTALGIPIRIYCCSPANFISKWFETTSTAKHVEELQQAAQKLGKSFDFKITEPQLQAPDSEAAIYAQVGIAQIYPELREGRGEVNWVLQQNLPQLVTNADIKGIIHAHSTYSDGAATLQAMANRCLELGYNYLAITDHSQAAFYANGLTSDRVALQHPEIDQLNEKFSEHNFKIFKGIEADILPDGSLDYDENTRCNFEVIIASVHSVLRMTEEKANQRLLKAIETPSTHILGHPTGRLLLARLGYPINHKLIIDACAANGVAIELNANPYRLDIDWTWLDYCQEKGVKIAINPDAHSLEGIGHTRYGVLAARKGKLLRQNLLNAYTPTEFEAWLKQKS